MATEVVMPRLSDTMDSGTISRWRKAEGEPIARGDVLAEIETDKANMELESYAAGVLAQIMVQEGESAALGQPIALIAADAEEAERLRAQPAGAATSTKATTQVQSGADGSTDVSAHQPSVTVDTVAPAIVERESRAAGGRLKASPLARRLAREQGIDLAQIVGTGPGGRITKADVSGYQGNGNQRAQPESPLPVPQETRVEQISTRADHDLRGSRRIEMSRMQRTIARRMTEARFSAPDFVLTSEVDMTEAMALIRQIRADSEAAKVGPNDLLIKAVAGALKAHPDVNAGWEADGIVQYDRINVGMAVAIPGGLVVPVIRDADSKTLGTIAEEARALIERARGGKLAPADAEGGTFSISNLGMYGISHFIPVINIPEACILGLGAIAPQPVVQDGQVVIRERMQMTLACDHRVVNGAVGAEFLRTLRHVLEHPLRIVV